MSGPLGGWNLCNHVCSGRGRPGLWLCGDGQRIHLKYVHWEPRTADIRKQLRQGGLVVSRGTAPEGTESVLHL